MRKFEEAHAVHVPALLNVPSEQVDEPVATIHCEGFDVSCVNPLAQVVHVPLPLEHFVHPKAHA